MYNENTKRKLTVPTDNYYYTATHEWVSLDDKNIITVGITYFAQEELEEISSWQLPDKGQSFERLARFGFIESHKSISDLIMPVSGEIAEVNESLTPSLLTDHPMDKGWLVKIEIAKEAELAHLLDPERYKKKIEKEIQARG